MASDFERCIKLDVVGGGQARSGTSIATLRTGHPDAVSRKFQTLHSACFSCQSVYFDSEASVDSPWRPCRRFVCVPYSTMHGCLFRADIPVKWKNLYEVIVVDRARHLYFDLEEARPVGCSSPEEILAHDQMCWAKVRLLQLVIRYTFECALDAFASVLYAARVV